MEEYKNNVIVEKSYKFALRIVKLYKYLISKKEFVFSKQLLRSGTSVGANVMEAQEGIFKKDFRAKMSIALKEAKESKYWICLLRDNGYLSQKQANNILIDLNEIIKVLTKIVKNAK